MLSLLIVVFKRKTKIAKNTKRIEKIETSNLKASDSENLLFSSFIFVFFAFGAFSLVESIFAFIKNLDIKISNFFNYYNR